jgi:hypothetical protein
VSEWQWHVVHDCGWWYAPTFGDPWFGPELCPNCGKDKGRQVWRWYELDAGWVRVKRRWVSTSQLLKPWTWGNGYWQEFSHGRST